jgi:hypothetical protein
MYLIVDDLESTALDHTFTAPKDCELGALTLYLYKAENPTGSLTLTIKQGSDTIYTETKTIASIISTVPNWTDSTWDHGEFDWQINPGVRLGQNVEYVVELSGTAGYTQGISWVKLHDDPVNEFYTTIDNEFDYPRSMLFWIWEDKGMIRQLNVADGFTSASAPAQSSIAVAIDGYYYYRSVAGTDTAGDWRESVDGTGAKVTEKYNGTSWDVVTSDDI